jgi:hypothetical protein
MEEENALGFQSTEHGVLFLVNQFPLPVRLRAADHSGEMF